MPHIAHVPVQSCMLRGEHRANPACNTCSIRGHFIADWLTGIHRTHLAYGAYLWHLWPRSLKGCLIAYCCFTEIVYSWRLALQRVISFNLSHILPYFPCQKLHFWGTFTHLDIVVEVDVLGLGRQGREHRKSPSFFFPFRQCFPCFGNLSPLK